MKIQELLPHLKKGWVAMDKNSVWFWYKNKPRCDLDNRCWWSVSEYESLVPHKALKIEFDGDWKDSLMKCGEKK